MKNLFSYRKTTIFLGLIGVLLGACSNKKVEIYDFECGRKSFEDAQMNIQYDSTKSKIRFISIEKKGEDEKIIGKEYDTFEKKGEVLFKIKEDWELTEGDAFLNLNSGRLKMPYLEKDLEIKQATLECKRI
jgi:hypothetical protein